MPENQIKILTEKNLWENLINPAGFSLKTHVYEFDNWTDNVKNMVEKGLFDEQLTFLTTSLLNVGIVIISTLVLGTSYVIFSSTGSLVALSQLLDVSKKWLQSKSVERSTFR